MKSIILLCCMYGLLMSAQAAEYGVRLGGLTLTPSGTAALASAGVAGTTLDLSGDMNLKRDTLPYAEASVFWGQHAFHASWLDTSFSGSSSSPALIFNFNGKAFFNPPYQFYVDVQMFDGGFSYYPLFVDRETWRLRFGAELAVKSLRTDVRMVEANFSQAVSSSAIIPTIGLRADASFKKWVTLSGHYAAYRMNGNSLSDAEVILDINPLATTHQDIMQLFVGYRLLKLKLSGQTNSQLQTDATMKGPTFGLRLHY